MPIHDRTCALLPASLAPSADPTGLEIAGVVKAQPCDPNTCLPPHDFPFTARLGTARLGTVRLGTVRPRM